MPQSIGLFLFTYLIVIFAFNNCSSVHQGQAKLSSFEACNLILKDEFSNGYDTFLKTNCNSCHTAGGTGNGSFADSDPSIAFDAFLVRGNNLVGSRATDPNHQPPYSGPQHTEQVSELDESWQTAKQQTDLCVARSGGAAGNDIPEGFIPNDPSPTAGTLQTFIKPIGSSQSRKTITWNLDDEIKTPGFSFPGALLSIDVQGFTTITGEKSYIFSNPKLQAGNESLHIVFIEFVINNNIVEDATSYHNIGRRVPMGETRDLAVGSTTFGFDVQSTDSIALSIGLLEAIDFNPPTYAELIAPTGVLGQNCLSCHNATDSQGGLDLSTREIVLQQLVVSPYSPNNSEVLKRMSDAQRPMPQSGLLPQPDIDQVLQWIQDGAP